MSDENEKVRSLAVVRAFRERNNELLSPCDALEEACRQVRSGEVACNKAFILLLHKEVEEEGISYFHPTFIASQIDPTEMLALARWAERQAEMLLGFDNVDEEPQFHE